MDNILEDGNVLKVFLVLDYKHLLVISPFHDLLDIQSPFINKLVPDICEVFHEDLPFENNTNVNVFF
jgi:hypothetical protein